MSPGPEPSVSWEEYIECVEELYENGATNGTGGVSSWVVLTELNEEHDADVSIDTVRHHLDGLVQNGELDAVYGLPRNGGGHPPKGYKPIDG